MTSGFSNKEKKFIEAIVTITDSLEKTFFAVALFEGL